MFFVARLSRRVFFFFFLIVFAGSRWTGSRSSGFATWCFGFWVATHALALTAAFIASRGELHAPLYAHLPPHTPRTPCYLCFREDGIITHAVLRSLSLYLRRSSSL